jgi:regulator of protease activity HflC (stomatin/prohibitin superfamily)
VEAFSWLADIVQAFGKLVPRLCIIRATHQGVKWRRGKDVRAMLPGLHWWWPLTTEVDTIVTARQTLNLPTQVLMTADRQQIVVGTLVVYRIKDVVEAIGKRNWDVECTVSDITQAAIVEVISRATLDDLLSDISAGVEKKLTSTCRRRLRRYGVEVNRCAVTDFSTCRVYKLIGNENGPSHHPIMGA